MSKFGMSSVDDNRSPVQWRGVADHQQVEMFLAKPLQRIFIRFEYCLIFKAKNGSPPFQQWDVASDGEYFVQGAPEEV